MGCVQFVYVTVTLWFQHILLCSVATHVIACNVHVTWQTNCTIMRHSLHKSTTIAKKIIPIHGEITAHGVKEANIAISKSLFERNVTFPHKFTRISHDNGCRRAF